MSREAGARFAVRSFATIPSDQTNSNRRAEAEFVDGRCDGVLARVRIDAGKTGVDVSSRLAALLPFFLIVIFS